MSDRSDPEIEERSIDRMILIRAFDETNRRRSLSLTEAPTDLLNLGRPRDGNQNAMPGTLHSL